MNKLTDEQITFLLIGRIQQVTKQATPDSAFQDMKEIQNQIMGALHELRNGQRCETNKKKL